MRHYSFSKCILSVQVIKETALFFLWVVCLSIPVLLIQLVNFYVVFQWAAHHSFPESLDFFYSFNFKIIWYWSRCR